MKDYSKMTIKEQSDDMRGFLKRCEMTKYMLPEQINLLRMALNALEAKERLVTLLKASHDLLKKQYDSSYVLNLLAEDVFYDEADCDGNCLMEDIEYYFDEIGVEMNKNDRVTP